MICECCKQEIIEVDHEWCEIENETKIGKYCVTNAQYEEFLVSPKPNPPSHWTNGQIPDGEKNYPVTNVSYFEALLYCAWLSMKLNKEVSLPTKYQWEKAAGDSEYPWGDEFDQAKCNNGSDSTVPVNSFPGGDSPIGCRQMSGNVWEWTKETRND